MPDVIPLTEIQRSPVAWRYEGGDAAALSFFITTFAKGEGPGLHRHSYAEVFLVEQGQAAFTVDGDEIVVDAGHVVVVPAGTPHTFTSASDAPLRVISMQPSPRAEQEWL